MGAFHSSAHELLGTELKEFVGHIHLVDVSLVTVKAGRGLLAGRVFDDDRGLTEVYEGRTGIAVPRHSGADNDGKDEPFPFRQKITEEVEHIEAAGFGFRIVHIDKGKSEGLFFQ